MKPVAGTICRRLRYGNDAGGAQLADAPNFLKLGSGKQHRDQGDIPAAFRLTTAVMHRSDKHHHGSQSSSTAAG